MSAVQSAEPWAGQDICHYIPQWLTSVTFMAFRYSVWKILHLFSNICFKSSFLWFQLNDSLMSVSRYAYCCIAAYKSFSLPSGVFYNFKTCPSWGWDFVHFNFPFFFTLILWHSPSTSGLRGPEEPLVLSCQDITQHTIECVSLCVWILQLPVSLGLCHHYSWTML